MRMHRENRVIRLILGQAEMDRAVDPLLAAPGADTIPGVNNIIPNVKPGLRTQVSMVFSCQVLLQPGETLFRLRGKECIRFLEDFVARVISSSTND